MVLSQYGDSLHVCQLVLQRKPFAFELFFLFGKLTHQKLSQMHGFLWRTRMSFKFYPCD